MLKISNWMFLEYLHTHCFIVSDSDVTINDVCLYYYSIVLMLKISSWMFLEYLHTPCFIISDSDVMINDFCLYYVLLLLFTTIRCIVVSLFFFQCGSCGLNSVRSMSRKVTDDSILTWLQRIALFLSLHFKSVCCVPITECSFSEDNFPSKAKSKLCSAHFTCFKSNPIHRNSQLLCTEFTIASSKAFSTFFPHFR